MADTNVMVAKMSEEDFAKVDQLIARGDFPGLVALLERFGK
jgi:hypothetical protein